jgi:hypothetical protein
MRRPAQQRDYAPRGMRLPVAADWVGFGTTKFLEMVKDGRMPPGKLVDGCRVWDRWALDESFDALPDEDSASGSAWGGVS